MTNVQQVKIDTPSGIKEIPAPAGWKMNDTDVITWSWLLTVTERLEDAVNDKKVAGKVILGMTMQINILSIVLANAVGMAASYWEMEARTFYKIRNDQDRAERMKRNSK